MLRLLGSCTFICINRSADAVHGMDVEDASRIVSRGIKKVQAAEPSAAKRAIRVQYCSASLRCAGSVLALRPGVVDDFCQDARRVLYRAASEQTRSDRNMQGSSSGQTPWTAARTYARPIQILQVIRVIAKDSRPSKVINVHFFEHLQARAAQARRWCQRSTSLVLQASEATCQGGLPRS